MKHALKYGFTIVALIVGIVHFGLALKAIFVFRNNEPISMWILVSAGPLSTLPASILAIFKPKAGGIWLICGAIISIIALVLNQNAVQDYASILWFLVRYTAPMLLLGVGSILLYGKGKL